MDLNEGLRCFLDSGRFSPITVHRYRSCLGRHIDFLDPDRDVERITVREIDEWASHLRARGLALSTVGTQMRAAHSFWAWLADRDHIAASPFRAPIPAQRLPPLRSRALNPSDRVRLLSATAGSLHPTRDYALLRFLADTACRVGALCRLCLEDLALDQSCALLNEKGSKELMAYYGRATGAALREWLAMRPAVATRAVFVTRLGGPFTEDGVRAILRRLATRAGVSERCSPHAWRHLVGLEMADARVPLSLIQAKLGHASASTTARYLNQDEGRLRAVTEALSAQF